MSFHFHIIHKYKHPVLRHFARWVIRRYDQVVSWEDYTGRIQSGG